MTDAPLFNGDPCQLCDSRRIDDDDDDFICIATPDGDRDCAIFADIAVMEHVAREVAVKFCRIGDRSLRREIAENTAEGFSNACHLQGRGVSFDESGFCALCGVPREASA